MVKYKERLKTDFQPPSFVFKIVQISEITVCKHYVQRIQENYYFCMFLKTVKLYMV